MKKKIGIGFILVVATLGGFLGSYYGINLIGLLLVLPIFILEMIIFTICHELSHGFVGEMNGLKFTVLYLGPFTFKRENKKFKKMKGVSSQLLYLGRAQIDNGEILNEKDVQKSIKAWTRALYAGPFSDLILTIVMLYISHTLKSYAMVTATVLVVGLMCIPSYIMGDGKHIKLIKKDKVFKDVVLYTYSIAGNTNVSKESKQYLLNRIVNHIKDTDIDEKNLISMVLAAQSVYQGAICGYIGRGIDNIDNIVELAIIEKETFLKKQIEQSYFKGLLNSAIIYETIIAGNIDKAKELHEQLIDVEHDMPGEELDFYRVQHVLGINDRSFEILDEELINPVFRGCRGITEIEMKINKAILNYKIMI